MAASSSSSSGEQQYSLKWNDYHLSILSTFRHLRDEEDFVDVTLACDSRSFTAHKVVLSACSPYFRQLLKANPCQHPIVILKDVASADMESLLRFMYHGEVHVGQERLQAFLKTAEALQIRGLADVGSGAASKIPPIAPTTRNLGSAPATPRNSWQDNGRGDFNDSGVSPPPEKRSRSYSPPLGNHVDGKTADLQESLLGQALEGGPTIHTPTNNIQSTGEDSNSMSDNEDDNTNNDSLLNSVKTEPSDLMNDSLEHHRNSFPAALLGLQGLMPGPSGIHAANQDPNYGRWQPLAGEGSGSGSGWLSGNSSTSIIPVTVSATTGGSNSVNTTEGGGGGTNNNGSSSNGGGSHQQHHHHNNNNNNNSSSNGTKQQQQQQQAAADITILLQQHAATSQHQSALSSLNTEQLTIMHQKLQNNLQSLHHQQQKNEQLNLMLQACSKKKMEELALLQPFQHHLDQANNPNALQGKPKCPECGKIYSNNSNLKQHIVNVHTVQTEYISCHICSKPFKTKQYLQIHLLSMHGIRKRKSYPVYQMPQSQFGQPHYGGSNDRWSSSDEKQ